VKITSIKQQEKRKDRYSIFVDGKYAFSLSESALLEQKLASGQELDKARLKDFKKLSADDKAYGNALRYVTMRPRSVWEMESYLRRKQVDEPVAKNIIAKLERIGFLDDAAFAKTWIENRRLLKATSKRRLIQELKQKRVAENVIQQALESDETDEREALRDLVAKKGQQSKYKNDKLKLMQYLARQGFNYDDIKSVLAES
jgi:regulatory protein